MVKRGEIWRVQLDPAVGSKIRKARPCVVVSPPELNTHLRTVLVAPMTSKGFAAPFRAPVTHAGVRGLILLDQMRAVDKTRLGPVYAISTVAKGSLGLSIKARDAARAGRPCKEHNAICGNSVNRP